MHPVVLVAATALARVLQVIFGILLGLPASRMAWRRGWWLSAFAAPVALVILMHVGGLIFAVPGAVVLTALYFAFSALHNRGGGWASAVHAVLGILVVFWTIEQAVQLPFRVRRQEAPARIAGNVAGLGMGVAVTLVFFESRAKRSAAGTIGRRQRARAEGRRRRG